MIKVPSFFLYAADPLGGDGKAAGAILTRQVQGFQTLTLESVEVVVVAVLCRFLLSLLLLVTELWP